MTNFEVKLNKKIIRAERQRKRSLKAVKANKLAGTIYDSVVPDINTCTSALFIHTVLNRVFFNGGDRWYSIDKISQNIPAINGKHIIFNPRNIFFLDLFYYNDTNKIYLPELMETVITGDLILDEIEGYLLYSSYLEVL